MSNFIFLLKDKSVEIKSKFDKYFKRNYDNIKYFLSPIDDHSFIMLKPKSYMKEFHHASISFRICILHDDFVSYLAEPTVAEYDNLITLMEYLHSLNRIAYCNKLSNSSEAPCYERTEFSDFSIAIYNKSNEKIYSCKMNLKTDNGRFGPLEILEKIDDIYHPVRKFQERYLDINTKWAFTNYPYDSDGLYGILHHYTKSISFYKHTDLQNLLSNVKTLYFCVSTYNPDAVSDDECEDKSLNFSSSVLNGSDYHWAIRIFDFWTNELETYLEFIEYNYYIRNNARFVSEMNDFNTFKGYYKVTISYEIETMIRRDNWTCLKRYIDNDDMLTIETVLNQL